MKVKSGTSFPRGLGHRIPVQDNSLNHEVAGMLFDARRDLAAKQVGADLVLYDLVNRDLHVLNMTAAKVFQLCDGSHKPEEIAKVLVESFDGVDYVQACEDVERILDILEAKRLVAPKSNVATCLREGKS